MDPFLVSVATAKPSGKQNASSPKLFDKSASDLLSPAERVRSLRLGQPPC
ncbi:hypothetical protein KFK09_019089 [Dendrobium nobile]|uniref:Uncharacterized protein n=1 Tax=Dendrobium nobile TaxID=94219 RepID=A0A8T3AXQ0_DENNO|nr:hypothetical protein KFK09_019089 [Dendrobium nobile]